MVLLVRMESQLRRFQQYRIYSGGKEQAYRIRGLELLTDKRIVLVDGDEVKLTPIEYNILLLLMENKGLVLSLARIYDEVWRMPVVRSDNTIAVHIRHIRKKIDHPEMSFPWGNTVTYFLYGIYLIIMTVLTIHGFKLFYDA